MPDAAPAFLFRDDGTRICGLADALELVGDRWALLVVREVGLGVTRFEQIRRHVGAPRQVLTARLRKLEEVGVLERRQYQDRPPRSEYRLTAAGKELVPVLNKLRTWGERNARLPSGGA